MRFESIGRESGRRYLPRTFAIKEDDMRYDIQGGNLPVVICYLENGESVITESGGMSWMSPNMQMQTSSNGGLGKG